ncbi:MAG: Guanylate kinase Gmk [Thermoanaerobacterales bacterium 50_218]|nr:MAG: Guanylate kinase Gmk [Thermoanaerobacterales bacterium 50_218]HAA89263.1 guanylate kinase [Peptococcaceae bacterium]
MDGRPLLIVISGPSGSGKGTLCRALRQVFPDLAYSVSVTTRPPRPGEVDGVDYIFLTPSEFEKRVQEGKLLEWAQVYENYYGTPREPVERWLEEGRDVLLELDVQGALQVKKLYPEALLIFIVPPSIEELGARIAKRGTDTKEVIKKRLSCAKEEIKAAAKYDYVVVNDHQEEALKKLVEIISMEKMRRQNEEGSGHATTQP